jgi:hypothetical protein
MTSLHTIDDALTDPHLLGAALVDQGSWRVWRVVLKAAFGLDLNEAEAQTFAQVAGGRSPPKNRVRELWCIISRRGGKSRMAGALSAYLALFGNHKLARGEKGMVLVLAASRDQSQVVFEYLKGFLEASPILRQEIVNIKASEIELRGNVVVAVHSNSFRTIRGRSILGCVMDEVSFWRDESSASPDIETYRAVLPSLATTNGMLIGISTPYRKLGLLHAKYRDHFGQSDDEILVVQGNTRTFNPTLDEKVIALQRAADPTAATSEWGAEFRSDISSFLDDASIDAAVEYSRPLELPPVRELFGSLFKAFTDSSGGVGADAYTLSICHKDGQQYVCDLVRGTKGKFDPKSVTEEYAALCKEYGISSVTGDAYASQWVQAAWRECSINYVQSDLPKSRIYLEVLPLFTRGLVRLPDHPVLLRELRLLERVVHKGGRDSVGHPKNGRDDYANALCGCLRLLSSHLGFDVRQMIEDKDDSDQNMTESDRNAAWRRAMYHNHILLGGRRFLW